MRDWQLLIETELLGSGLFDKGAIFSAAGDSIVADTPGFHMTPEEVRTIIGAYSDSSAVQVNGFHVAGHEYVYVRHDDRTLMGRSRDRSGVICTKTKLAIIVGTYVVGAPPQEASKVIEAVADFMIERDA